MNEIRISVLDDHEMFISGLSELLGKESGFEIASVIKDPEGLLRELEDNLPDVLLMDIRLGAYNGLDLTKEVKRIYPGLCVILMSGFNISSVVVRDSGADGFVSKEDSISQLSHIIRMVFLGNSSVFPRFNSKSLTETEIQILQLIKQDMTRKEIALELHICEKTVTNHISSIIKKMEARSRVGALVKAIEMGILQ